INPINGFKKFFALKSLVELTKGILKLIVVGGIAYWTLMEHRDRYLYLVYGSVGDIMFFIGSLMFQLVLRTLAALLAMAILDLIYQRWQFKKDMKMTKEEVKEEAKQMEGDPLVKGAIKSLQQTRSRERMMSNVEEADVVVTNPVHLAVAMKYDPEETGAPIVLAKGARILAEKIKEIATEHKIPIIENKPLARSLYKLGQIGKEIPFELFHTVAEVFAYVYQMKNRMN
ncbi:EscU/YscU/HrcU family type III secretion system export apparatus switch protein, partial [bacterium]|nr:EscU/YscU/HrcU family type III secretion system export apparatus switch protein [bacterium]